TLRTGILAGASVGPEDYRRICNALPFERLQMSYGQSETSPGVTFSHKEDTVEDKCDNAGYLIPGIEACVWDETGRQHIITDGEGAGIQGELGFRGYVVMQGYYNMPEATKEVLQEDGWLHTGDLGYYDKKLRVHIIGRKKDMIIRGGENISPAEIEECIRKLPEVKDVRVVGVHHPILQEEVAAAVALHHGCHLTQEAIKEQVEAHMARYKVPEYVAFLEDLPMNSSGKVQTGKIREIMKQYVQELHA
ncbi:MAG: AMP-binding protein, partial [Agathobacter sp.]|nr:AMP-binding protein [Agathobacter sp.]